jgi:hypothetical protein
MSGRTLHVPKAVKNEELNNEDPKISPDSEEANSN